MKVVLLPTLQGAKFVGQKIDFWGRKSILDHIVDLTSKKSILSSLIRLEITWFARI